MKKLKIALSLIFALTFSLFLVACGGGGEVMDIVINTENAKTEFKEGEAFNATGLVVNVYYRGKDDPVTLEEGKYNIDSSKFDSSKPAPTRSSSIPNRRPQKTRSALRSRTPSRSSITGRLTKTATPPALAARSRPRSTI